MSDPKVMLNPKDMPAVPKAVAGIRAMRDRLAAEIPSFAAAQELEQAAESFCRSVRADLRSRRKQQGLDQAELGARMDMTQSTVSKMEKGEGDLGLKTLYRFAEALGFRPVVLLVPSVRLMLHEPEPEGTAFQEAGRGSVTAAGTSEATTVAATAVAIEDLHVKLLRQMSDSVSTAMAALVKG